MENQTQSQQPKVKKPRKRYPKPTEPCKGCGTPINTLTKFGLCKSCRKVPCPWTGCKSRIEPGYRTCRIHTKWRAE